MTKPPRLNPCPERQRQLSLPFRPTHPPTPLFQETQRTAVVALLGQMLIDAVLAQGVTRVIDNNKETDHE